MYGLWTDSFGVSRVQLFPGIDTKPTHLRARNNLRQLFPTLPLHSLHYQVDTTFGFVGRVHGSEVFGHTCDTLSSLSTRLV